MELESRISPIWHLNVVGLRVDLDSIRYIDDIKVADEFGQKCVGNPDEGIFYDSEYTIKFADKQNARIIMSHSLKTNFTFYDDLINSKEYDRFKREFYELLNIWGQRKIYLDSLKASRWN